MIFLHTVPSLTLPVAVSGMIALILSITEPKQAQRKLAREQALLRCLIDAVSDLIFIKDRDGVYRGCNKASEDFIGLPECEQIGKTDFDFFDRKRAEQVRKIDRRVLEQGKPLRIEEWVTCRDGRRQLMDTLKAPYYGPDGEALGLVGIGRDITERKLAEEALRASEAKYIDLYECAPDMYVSVNADTALVDECNLTLALALGYSKEEIIGRPVFAIYHPDCLDEVKKTYKGFLETGMVHEKELQLRRQDGSKLDVSLNASAVRDQAGKILYSRSTLRDITESKRNNAINRARLHLMQFAVSHSLDELLEETLNQAEKLTDSLIGFYHFVQDDQKTLSLQNWSSATKANFCRAEGKGSHYAISEAGVWVDCVYQRKPVIHNDYAALAHRRGMPKGHAEVVRELVVPVLRGDRIKAILGIGNKPADYNQKDVETISLLADFAWEIVERKQLDDAFRESEARYRVVADNTYDWEQWIDVDGQLLYSSPSCQRITGYTADEFTRQPDLFNRIIHPEDRDGFIRHQQQVEAKQRPGEVDFRILHSNGSMRHIGHVCQPVFGAQGQYLGIRCSNRDISDRKLAEAELARHRNHLEDLINERTEQLGRSEEHYRRLFETMLQGVVYQDADGTITSLNPAAERILGVDRSELLGKTSLDREPHTIRQDGSPYSSAEHPAMVALDTGSEVRDAVMGVYNPREQRYRWINVNAMPLFRAGEDRPYQVYTIFDDITQRRQVEAEIAQLNRNLQERAAALEEANKELEAFGYTVSHDLRAPLRHIDGFLELLQKRAAPVLDEQSRHYMDTISRSALRMASLIDDLLALSRIGRNQMTCRPVDLAELTREVIKEYEPETGNRNIDWCIDDLPVVTGDRSMLRMVLVNLISNALKFTRPRSRPQIEIGSIRGQASEVVIFVRDNGVGFDMAYAGKLFGVFQRLHRAEQFEGTGIGLANVRRIIARHGGRTWAEGKVDDGATFYFALHQPNQQGEQPWKASSAS